MSVAFSGSSHRSGRNSVGLAKFRELIPAAKGLTVTTVYGLSSVQVRTRLSKELPQKWTWKTSPTPPGTKNPSTKSPPFGTRRGKPSVRGGYMRMASRHVACRYRKPAAEVALMSSYVLNVERISERSFCSTAGFLQRKKKREARATAVVSDPARLFWDSFVSGHQFCGSQQFGFGF